MIPKITTGDHSKRADRRERTRFRAAQRVLATAVAHNLPLQATRKVEVLPEDISRIDSAAPSITIAVCPLSAAVTVVPVPAGVGLTRIVSRPTTRRARIIVALPAVVIAFARIVIVEIRSMVSSITEVSSDSGLTPLILATSVAVVVSVAWVVSPPWIVEHERSFDRHTTAEV